MIAREPLKAEDIFANLSAVTVLSCLSVERFGLTRLVSELSSSATWVPDSVFLVSFCNVGRTCSHKLQTTNNKPPRLFIFGTDFFKYPQCAKPTSA